MIRRATAKALDQLDRLELNGHLYFHAVDGPPDPYRAPAAPRALLVFLCPAEGPQSAEDWSVLRRVMTGRGIGRYGVVYLFTAMGVRALDLPDHPGAVGPLAGSTLSAAIRWVDRPWRDKGGDGQAGHVTLCHGQPWPAHARRGQAMADRQARLWSALRTFKRPVFQCGPGLNPLDAQPGQDIDRRYVRTGPDGLPGAERSATAWWALPRP